MSIDFVKGRHGSKELAIARRQQEQLSYFTQSKVQEPITAAYLNQWANRNYSGNDYFLNWVKMVFRMDNFLSFYKYMRHPLPSARLINDEIIPQLNRVFTAEDAYRRYTVFGKPIETPMELEFDEFVKKVFNQYLFGHNNIIFTDLKDINTPYREFIEIDDVIAIEAEDCKIKQIAFTAEMYDDTDQEIKGFLYADDKEYIFYDEKYNIIKRTPHDLGECPADFVSQEMFSDEEVIRKSIFSYVREELEEYVFLNTLLKMTEANGAIPVVTKLKTQETSKQGIDKKGVSAQEPMSSFELGGQTAKIGSDLSPSESVTQAGTVITVPVLTDSNGKVDMDIVTKFMQYFYVPVEALKYINDRISAIRDSITTSIVGQFKDNVDVAKNDKQINTGISQKQDNLRRIADNLSKVITSSDRKFLSLQYGAENVTCDIFFGTDFFLESADDLYNLFEKSPNPLESRNILIRLSKNRNRNNPTMAKRDEIMYKILPFANDKDFQTALNQQIVDDITKQLQLRFNYWIDLFEAEFGDLVAFWNNDTSATDTQKIILITNLIKTKINEQTSSSQTPSV